VNVHAKSRLILETSAGTPARDQGPGGSLPGPDAGHPLHRAGGHDLTTRTRAPRCQTSSTNGSHGGSHGNERLPDCLDVPGQPTGTRPKSRTVSNGPGHQYGHLRVRRSCPPRARQGGRPLAGNTAAIATWLDAREPDWQGDLTRKRSRPNLTTTPDHNKASRGRSADLNHHVSQHLAEDRALS